MKMIVSLDMNRHHIGARLGKFRRIPAWIRDHQVGVDGQIPYFSDRLYDWQTYRDVWHELPVHHVNMQHAGPARTDRLYLVAKPRKVGRKDRGCYFKHSLGLAFTLLR